MQYTNKFLKKKRFSAPSLMRATAPTMLMLLSLSTSAVATAQEENGEAVVIEEQNTAIYSIGQPIEAEDFVTEFYESANTNHDYSVRKLINGDDGKVGYIKADGNWIKFEGVDFADGITKITVDASSERKLGGILSFHTEQDSSAFAQVKIDKTDSWNDFEPFTVYIGTPDSPKGTHDVYLKFYNENGELGNNSYLYDIDSFRFDKPLNEVGQTIEAESFSAESYTGVDDDFDVRRMVKEGKVGYIKPTNNFIRFANFNFGTGVTGVRAKASSATNGGTLTFHDDPMSDPFAKVTINPTNGWNDFQDFSALVDFQVDGISTLYLKFSPVADAEGLAQEGDGQYLFDLDSFYLEGELAQPEPVEAAEEPEEPFSYSTLQGETGEFYNGQAEQDPTASVAQYFSPDELITPSGYFDRTNVSWNSHPIQTGSTIITLRVKSKDGQLRKGRLTIEDSNTGSPAIAPIEIETDSTVWQEITVDAGLIAAMGRYDVTYSRRLLSAGEEDLYQALDLDFIKIETYE